MTEPTEFTHTEGQMTGEGPYHATPTPLDAAWEALASAVLDGFWEEVTSHDLRERIARHRPLIEAEAAAAERERIYMALVDRLWGCDADAWAVLNIVENES